MDRPHDAASEVVCPPAWRDHTPVTSQHHIQRFKARLVPKGIFYNEIFFPMSSIDSLRIIIMLVEYYHLKLHQVDAKTSFLHGDLHEDIYMIQSSGFLVKGKEHMRD